MSIATEITRLQDAKAAIKTAIAGKGQTVADTARLSDFAALIEAISTGHEFPTVMKNVKVTEVTATSDAFCTIPWDKDTLPKRILVFDTAVPSSGDTAVYLQRHTNLEIDTSSRVSILCGILKNGSNVTSEMRYHNNAPQDRYATIENFTLKIFFRTYNTSGVFTSGHTLAVITYDL